MKFTLSLCTFLTVFVSAKKEFSPESVAGRHLLSHARRLNNNNNNNQDEDDTWLTSMSIKFQGCHSIKQWNAEADGEEDVRVATKNLVRFRLCPTESCTAQKGTGCTAGYGEYIVDMPTFLQAWWESSQQNIEAACQNYLYTSCNCDKDNNQGDDFNEEYCQYDCFNNAGKTECIDRNPYQEDEQAEQFEPEQYMECQELKIQNNNRRKLENNQQEEVKYYVGPKCDSQGGGIMFGLFTDDACSVSTNVTFTSLMGYELPYTSKSLVTADCLSCVEPKDEDQNNQNNGGEADADAVSEACEQLYTAAGKCEQNYADGMVTTPNTNACTYLEGIKLVASDGMVHQSKATQPSKVATSFIVIFALAFAGMAFYVHYLRTRLGTKKDTLLQ